MDRKYVAAVISVFLFSLLAMGIGCRPIGPLRPFPLPSTPTPFVTPTPVHSPVATGDPTPVISNTVTNSPTNSPTNTPTNTPVGTSGTILPTHTFTVTPSPTPAVTACQTARPFGESDGTGSVTVSGTLCQQYTFSQPFQLNIFFVSLAAANPSVTVGVYTDNSNYPGTLVWSSPSISMVAGGNSVFLQSPMFSGNPAGISLPAGTYWLAVSSPSVLYLTAASGSTAKNVIGPGVFPNSFPIGNPVNTVGQASMSVEINTCSARPTQIATYTPAPPAATSTPDPTLVPSNTPTITFTATATPHTSPVPSIPATGIFWASAYVQDGGSTSYLQLFVNGSVSTNSAVTLTTPDGPLPFTYNAVGFYYASGPITYVPGGSYTLTSVTPIGTAYATLVAPGGNINVASDGSAASWDYEGNEDWLTVQKTGTYAGTYLSYNYTSDIDSIFSIPGSAYPAAGTYAVSVHPQSTTYNITGAMPNSRYTIDSVGLATITK